MQKQNELNPALREMEALLTTLVPKTQADPVAAAFAAGQKMGSRRLRLWQSALVVLLATGLGLRLVPVLYETPTRPSSDGRPLVSNQWPSVPSQRAFDQSLLMLEKAVNEKGLDNLPRVRRAPAQTISGSEIL